MNLLNFKKAKKQVAIKIEKVAKQQLISINGGTDVVKTVSVPKQTQGSTFGEKVNAGLHQAGSALANGKP